jgi:sodium/potassium-transporting ATPase subunit alpha
MFVTDCLISASAFSPELARDRMVMDKKASGIHQLRAAAGLCNAGEFDASTINLPLPDRRIYGDATDQAILRFSEGLGSTSELRQAWKMTFQLPFNSKNKFMIRTFSVAEPNGYGVALSPAEAVGFKQDDTLLTIKGAPDILIERCTHTIGINGKVEILNERARAKVLEVKDRWSREGRRVILLARKVLPGSQILVHPSSREFESEVMSQAKTGLVLVGLVAIIDPPREEIPDVMKTLRRAGIRIFMVCSSYLLKAGKGFANYFFTR